MKIKVNKLRQDAKLPLRAHYNDAGADVYALDDYLIEAYSSLKIPLGISLELPDGYMAVLHSRSSLAQVGLTCENPPIDSGYRGEIHAMVTNHNRSPYRIHKGDRIAQLVVQPVTMAEFVETLGEDRGEGAFGSTGK